MAMGADMSQRVSLAIASTFFCDKMGNFAPCPHQGPIASLGIFLQ